MDRGGALRVCGVRLRVRAGRAPPRGRAPRDGDLPADSVDVYFHEDELPSEDCERLAILSGSGHSDWTNVAAMLEKLREEAGKLGANVVRLRAVDEANWGERISGALSGAGSQRRSSAVALHCPAAEERSRRGALPFNGARGDAP